ncbi:helix-turn-helix domain-containing protein [Neobacillus novalis]|uniref:Helix-turn-helix domain-containing protein n=1 Tax=Neobacillus novalis TaxID=220687 RepID=A0AA95SA01_9BACI|nr:helix-turn-helix domain-containing protein [Neobacillus novalis]WHY87570.1 helix-turn-helix domain-containing protein [Neobacillus novalis]
MREKMKFRFRRIDKLDSNFTQISNNVFYILKGKATAYMVYSYLNHRYNTTKCYAFPSISTIQKDLGIGSNKTVVSAIELLEEKRLVKVIREKQSNDRNAVNKYVVYFPVAINPLSKEEEELAPEEFVEMIAL